MTGNKCLFLVFVSQSVTCYNSKYFTLVGTMDPIRLLQLTYRCSKQNSPKNDGHLPVEKDLRGLPAFPSLIV